ncbi:hypothetical protein ACF1HJ_41710 [Streptomyces sp. NPDC013978]|uniref:hypothetical protein n=1 Tax=Streptomyces sp. NPDC013978 TaxID=3364869 RepID=UPI0036F72648
MRLGSGPHLCDVWNIDGGTTSKWGRTEYEQQSFNRGTRGGNGTGQDVDGAGSWSAPVRSRTHCGPNGRGG